MLNRNNWSIFNLKYFEIFMKSDININIRVLSSISVLFWSGESVKLVSKKYLYLLMTYWAINSMGMGKTMVEFFSEEMVARVCRYLSWSAAGLSDMMSLASFRALLAFCSPSAAMTFKSCLSLL